MMVPADARLASQTAMIVLTAPPVTPVQLVIGWKMIAAPYYARNARKDAMNALMSTPVTLTPVQMVITMMASAYASSV